LRQKKRIAIIFHAHAGRKDPNKYAISILADIWRQDGLEVFFVWGVKKFIPADLAILHVDLSIVPDEYIEFARRYPIVLNGRVKDIRKSSFSQNILARDDVYDGKVIVKSDLNCAGSSERKLDGQGISSAIKRYTRPFSFKKSIDYKVFDCISDVPSSCFNNRYFLVEKFLPEKKNGRYFIRCYYFLGERGYCIRLAAKYPIVNSRTYEHLELIDPHPEILKLCERLQFDYGKFDYVIHDNRVILLDINKTTGTGKIKLDPQMEALRKHWAAAIYSYFS